MMIAARDMTWGDSKPTEYWGLCFTALEANSTITMKRSSSLAPSVTLETSINGRTWKPFSVNNTTIQLKEAGSKVYFRAGEGGNKSLASRSGDSTLYNYFSATGKISASGSIQSLLNGDEPTEIINSAYCYYSLFRGCTSLVKAPALPATKLPSYCYSYMFFGCTSLVEAPALPATTAQTYCYYSMFRGCTSLVEAPALPATTLAGHCYSYMFSGCTSLVEAPALPATTAQTYCYYSMFSDCTSLVEAPALPATTLAGYCYQFMFSGCTSLVEAPALPATTAQTYCYSYMFRGCTSLVEAPALPATTLAGYCYQSMFSGCTSLVEAPALPATTLVLGCYNYMFDKCTLLSEVKVPFPYREWYAGDRTVHWLNGVSASGRFICHSDLGRNSSILRGTSFCPNGWVVENIENIFSQKDGQ